MIHLNSDSGDAVDTYGGVSTTRRQVLRSLSILSLLATVGPIVRSPTDRRNEQALADETQLLGELERLFPEFSRAQELGRAYLDSFPTATRAIETLRGELTEAGSCGLQRLGVLIRERRDGDLSEGRTVFVKGWLLAETEAGLCGLLVGGRIA